MFKKYYKYNRVERCKIMSMMKCASNQKMADAKEFSVKTYQSNRSDTVEFFCRYFNSQK